MYVHTHTHTEWEVFLSLHLSCFSSTLYIYIRSDSLSHTNSGCTWGFRAVKQCNIYIYIYMYIERFMYTYTFSLTHTNTSYVSAWCFRSVTTLLPIGIWICIHACTRAHTHIHAHTHKHAFSHTPWHYLVIRSFFPHCNTLQHTQGIANIVPETLTQGRHTHTHAHALPHTLCGTTWCFGAFAHTATHCIITHRA